MCRALCEVRDSLQGQHRLQYAAGVGWVQLAQRGVALPILGSATGARVNVIDPVLLAGPDYVSVPVKALRGDAEDMMQ